MTPMRIGIVVSPRVRYPQVHADGFDISSDIPIDQAPAFRGAVPGSTFAFEMLCRDAAGRPYVDEVTGEVARIKLKAIVDAVEFV